MPKVSAAIVMYGGEEEVYNCLQSIEKFNTNPSLKVFIVDNASPENALAKLKQKGIPSFVEILQQEENKGFGTGHNAVIPFLDSKYHAVVNPDIILMDDAFDKIVNWMEAHPDVAIVTPHLVFPDGREQNIAKRRPAFLPLLARQLNIAFLKKYESHYLMLDEDLSKPIDVEFCSGCFFVIRTEIFKQMKGFDEAYFMYVEDADITQKARAYGRAVYLPDVTVAHAWHRAARRNPKQFLWQLKSMGRYFKKWGFRWK